MISASSWVGCDWLANSSDNRMYWMHRGVLPGRTHVVGGMCGRGAHAIIIKSMGVGNCLEVAVGRPVGGDQDGGRGVEECRQR